ncbi:MAG: PD40 domain-containing protein [Nitrospinae bacterium]|nr:PD40 domain-containing protein [Nitrospinota bacterium]
MMGNLAALAALTLYLAAQPAPVFPARVAAGPAEDYMPALSADGELMAFVSNRAGAPNIWLMKLAEGPLQLPRRLTSGTAGEKSPAFSPDGKWLAFVSSSTDAEGDLFLLSVTAALRGEGPPPAERLTDGATADRDPVFTADGRALIYSAADKTGGPPGLWRLNLKSRERERLTADGQNPAVSPDGRQVVFVAREGDGGGLALLDPRTGERRALLGGKGIALFPAFAGDERVVFTWYAEDSNNDGAITIDDRPALYALDLARPGAPPYPLTSTESYALFPAARGDTVYFTAREDGVVDIVSLPLAGMAPPQESAAADIARARERERYYPNRPALGILAWRAALAARGEDGAALERAGISLELSRVYEQAGLLREAETLARAVAEQFPSARREAGLASLRATLLFARRTGKSPGWLIERLAALEKEWAAAKS